MHREQNLNVSVVTTSLCIFLFISSCFKHDISSRCTNLCGSHLSVKGKVSLFAVGLLSQTDRHRSERQARKQEEPNV